ncbi:hypothetical protein GGF46_002532 [Coemansia sp. RSA 552]|nr:hypothetical protein GGF46_002532 [Coemansia sp. RSA 552]
MKVAALVFVAATVLLGANAGHVVTYPPHIRTKRGSYIVEFDSHIPSTHVSRLHAIPNIAVERQFSKVFNGASVTATGDLDPEHLASVDGVKRVWPVRYFRPALARNARSQNTTANASYLHHMTGVSQTLKELGLTGKGVKIGIVDTGIDYTHPDLGGCWKTKGCIWQYGEDYIGDKFSVDDEHPIIEPNQIPTDCNGHGTHVAGIIAAKGTQVQGIAPEVTLGMYRVFSCPGTGEESQTTDDIILQGIEGAFNDGHDIISLSLGGGDWPEDPVAVACTRIVEQGVVVVAAANNDGMGGLHSVSSPGVAQGVISVGSVDNWNITTTPGILTTSQDRRSIMLSSPGSKKHPFVFDTDMPIVAPIDSAGGHNGCANYTEDLSGKIALVRRGECLFDIKARAALDAGAVGVLCINNAPGFMSVVVADDIAIPFVMVSTEDGEYIARSISRGNATIRAMQGQYESFPADGGGMMSWFSSYGPSPELGMTPLISAPGGNIWSTYPVRLGGYTTLSGTSMATPYVSGAIALLKQARPGLSVDEIRSFLVSSGKLIIDPVTNLATSPFKSGSGLVNIHDAIKSRVAIYPSAISLNGSRVGPIRGHSDLEDLGTVRWEARTVTLKNIDSRKSMRVSLANARANSLSMFQANGSFGYTPRTWPPDSSSVPDDTHPQIYSPNIPQAVAPGKTADLTVFIVAPRGLRDSEQWYYGGFLNFTLQWDGETTTCHHMVPYGGYNGEYSAQDVLPPPESGLPMLIDVNAKPIKDLSAVAIENNATVFVMYSLVMPSREVTLALVDSATGRRLGYLPDGYVPMSGRSCPDCLAPGFTAPLVSFVSTKKDANAFVPVPPGTYHVHLRALCPLGEVGNEDDYQTWDSPDFDVV